MEKRYSNSSVDSKTPVTLVQELFAKKGLTPEYTLVHGGIGSHCPLFIYRLTGLGKTTIGKGKSKREAKHAAAEEFLSLVNETLKELDDVILNPFSDKLKENAVGALQDFCLTYMIDLPKYEQIDDEGPPHAKEFIAICNVSSFLTEAKGRSKKQAKHIAAYLMLQKLRDQLKEGDLCIFSEDGNQSLVEERKRNKAIERLGERLAKEVVIPKDKQRKELVLPFANVFMQEEFLNSELLNEIKGQNEDYFDQMFNPSERFKNLMEEIHLQWEQSKIPMKKCYSGWIFCLHIKDLGNATFFGLGNDEESALEAAALSALQWFSVMSL